MPEDLDYCRQARRVIGSGATAGDAGAGDGQTAAHVTMLQRFADLCRVAPGEDPLANKFAAQSAGQARLPFDRWRNVMWACILPSSAGASRRGSSN